MNARDYLDDHVIGQAETTYTNFLGEAISWEGDVTLEYSNSMFSDRFIYWPDEATIDVVLTLDGADHTVGELYVEFSYGHRDPVSGHQTARPNIETRDLRVYKHALEQLSPAADTWIETLTTENDVYDDLTLVTDGKCTNDPTVYEVILGTDVTDDVRANADTLAVAQAVAELREVWIADIHAADTVGGGDQQYGVRLELSTYEPPAALDRHAETVEVIR